MLTINLYDVIKQLTTINNILNQYNMKLIIVDIDEYDKLIEQYEIKSCNKIKRQLIQSIEQQLSELKKTII